VFESYWNYWRVIGIILELFESYSCWLLFFPWHLRPPSVDNSTRLPYPVAPAQGKYLDCKSHVGSWFWWCDVTYFSRVVKLLGILPKLRHWLKTRLRLKTLADLQALLGALSFFFWSSKPQILFLRSFFSQDSTASESRGCDGWVAAGHQRGGATPSDFWLLSIFGEVFLGESYLEIYLESYLKVICWWELFGELFGELFVVESSFNGIHVNQGKMSSKKNQLVNAKKKKSQFILMDWQQSTLAKMWFELNITGMENTIFSKGIGRIGSWPGEYHVSTSDTFGISLRGIWELFERF